jgi:hypothetical protein
VAVQFYFTYAHLYAFTVGQFSSSFFWNIVLCHWVSVGWHFWTAWWSSLQGSHVFTGHLTFEDGPSCCPDIISHQSPSDTVQYPRRTVHSTCSIYFCHKMSKKLAPCFYTENVSPLTVSVSTTLQSLTSKAIDITVLEQHVYRYYSLLMASVSTFKVP